jgi:hypothetical protein
MALLTDEEPWGVDSVAPLELPRKEASHACEIFQKKTGVAGNDILKP